MQNPRAPYPEDGPPERPEDHHDEQVRRDIEPPEAAERPEVIREEVTPPQERPRNQDVLSEDLVPRQGHADEPAGTYESPVEPYEERHSHTAAWARTSSLWVAVIAGVTGIFLLFRLGLLWAGANAEAGFVTFINRSTSWMVAPFQGIAPDVPAGAGTLDMATIIATLVYLLAALIVITALRVLGSVPHHDQDYPGRPARRTRAY